MDNGGLKMKRAMCSIMILAAAMAVVTGCFTSATAYTKKTAADGVVTESKCSIIGTGDKVSQIAADGLFADGTTEDLGAGVKKASASQQSTGIGETLNGIGALLKGMAALQQASSGVKLPDTADSAPDVGMPTAAAVSLPPETVAANASALSEKMAEAKSSGKQLVVIAGNVGCGYCSKLDALLDASPDFTGRSDIVLYRETSPWATNQAGKWTGGGLFPVVRVTQWNSAGAVGCDKKINRPTSIAAIEAALGSCEVNQ